MRISLIIIMIVLAVSATAQAEYTDSCGLYAQMLWSAADDYESAKSSYKSACDPDFGFSSDDEMACGEFGYERERYQRAKRELVDALESVASFCGTCDGYIRPMARAYKKKVKELETEISHLKGVIKRLEKENKALTGKNKTTE